MTQAVAQQEAVPAADGQQRAAPNRSAPPPAQPADQAPYATIPVPTKAPPPVATTPANNSRKIEEVIITARRISESMHDVPVAVTVLSATDLQRETVTSAQDLQGRVATLTIQSTGPTRNIATPNIRGQGTTYASSPGADTKSPEVPL